MNSKPNTLVTCSDLIEICRLCIELLEKREPDPKYRTTAEDNRLRLSRAALYDDTVEWLQVFMKFFPAAHPSVGQVDIQSPEKARLPLPSQLPHKTCIRYGMEGLISVEYTLRIGQAHDILAEIRELIIGQSYNTRIIRTEFHGQRMRTCAHEFVSHFQLDKVDCMHRYNFVRKRLITLGMSPTDLNLHKLTAAHITAKNAAQSRGLGDTMKPNSWLWGVLKPEGLAESAEDEWSTESMLAFCCYF